MYDTPQITYMLGDLIKKRQKLKNGHKEHKQLIRQLLKDYINKTKHKHNQKPVHKFLLTRHHHRVSSWVVQSQAVQAHTRAIGMERTIVIEERRGQGNTKRDRLVLLGIMA